MAKYKITIPATSQVVLTCEVDMDYDDILPYIQQIGNDNFFEYGALGIQYTEFDYENVEIQEIIADDEINQDLQELEEYYGE